MIITSINSPDLANYAKLNPYFAQAFEEIKKMLENGIEKGRTEFVGDKLYANVSEYDTKLLEKALYEAHKDYIDIQVILEGEEIIGYDTEDKLTATTEYVPGDDYILYALNDEYASVRIGKGEMAIIFPDEPHAPGMSIDNKPAHVKKAVVKVWAK